MIFRDGVGEGQIEYVKDIEVAKVTASNTKRRLQQQHM